MRPHHLWRRLRSLIASRRVERELDEELAFHLEMQTRKHLEAGLGPIEARRRARAQFGSTAWVEDQCRDARGMMLIDSFRQDCRYALRSFRRAPTFTLTVISTIALGLALNTAFFTIFNAYLLRPAPVRDPDSLYLFTYVNRDGRGHFFSWNEFQRFQQENQVFAEVFAGRKQLIAQIDGVVAFGQLVTGNYFAALGVDAALGRTLNAGDVSTPGGEAAIVLSHSFWQRHFGGDAAAVGRTIRIHGYPCVVVGVAREGFVGLDLVPHDYWAPITLDARLEDGPDLFGAAEPNRLEIIGRLRPGVGVRSARAALRLWSRTLTASRAEPDRAIDALLDPKRTSIPLKFEIAVVVLPILVAVGLVLAIACANVANLMLARAVARQREVGMRLSLGAARSRIIFQFLTESLLLALPAAIAGLVLSQIVVQACLQILSATLPPEAVPYIRLMPLAPDARVVAFSVVAAFGSALLFGLAPALQATRAGVVQTARGDFKYDVRSARARSTLIVVQIAASALLLIGAAVLLRGANRIAGMDLGMRTDDVIAIAVGERSRTAVLSSLASEPLVTAVAATRPAPPLTETAFRASVVPSDGAALTRSFYRYVSPEYFEVFGIPLVGGRTFTQEEAIGGASVAIVSQTAARRFWPSHNALGQALTVVPDAGGDAHIGARSRDSRGRGRSRCGGRLLGRCSRKNQCLPSHQRP